MKRLAFFAFLLSASVRAFQPAPPAVVEFGLPFFGGAGCPGTGTLRVLDQTKMIYEIDFGGYTVEAGGNSGRVFDRKNCSVGIPVKVNAGTSIAVSRIKYAGFNDLNDGATVRVVTEAFFAGTRSPMIQKQFATTGEFNIDLQLSEVEKSWSSCGAATNLRLNISDDIKTQPGELHSISKIEGKLVFHLEAQRCS